MGTSSSECNALFSSQRAAAVSSVEGVISSVFDGPNALPPPPPFTQQSPFYDASYDSSYTCPTAVVSWDEHPLFISSIPSPDAFERNPLLGGLAALLDESDDDDDAEEEEKKKNNKSYGPIRRRRSSSQRGVNIALQSGLHAEASIGRPTRVRFPPSPPDKAAPSSSSSQSFTSCQEQTSLTNNSIIHNVNDAFESQHQRFYATSSHRSTPYSFSRTSICHSTHLHCAQHSSPQPPQPTTNCYPTITPPLNAGGHLPYTNPIIGGGFHSSSHDFALTCRPPPQLSEAQSAIVGTGQEPLPTKPSLGELQICMAMLKM